jgi:capsular polysaccharide biosynthesis protein
MKVLWVGVLIAAVVTAHDLYQIPKYEATAKVLVGEQQQGDGSESGAEAGIRPIPNANATSRQGLPQKMAGIIHSRSVAEETVRRLNLPRGAANELLDNLTIERDPGTMLIRLTYTDSEPTRAKIIVNAVAQVAHDHTRSRDFTATLWEPAKLPTTPVSPKPLRNGLIALVAGLLLASAWAIAAKLARIRPPPADLDRGPA